MYIVAIQLVKLIWALRRLLLNTVWCGTRKKNVEASQNCLSIRLLKCSVVEGTNANYTQAKQRSNYLFSSTHTLHSTKCYHRRLLYRNIWCGSGFFLHFLFSSISLIRYSRTFFDSILCFHQFFISKHWKKLQSTNIFVSLFCTYSSFARRVVNVSKYVNGWQNAFRK